MFTLEDITLIPYITKIRAYSFTNKEYENIYNFLVSNSIYDFKKLEEFIKLQCPLTIKATLYKLLIKAYALLDKINSNKLETKIYSSSKLCSTFDTEITKTDFSTMVKDILITHPVYSGSIPKRISGVSIASAEYLRSKIDLSGKNALSAIWSGVGPYRLEQFSNDLARYREQLRRILNEIPKDSEGKLLYDGNLFYKDFDAKKDLILVDLNNILTYMLNNSSTFIWGNLDIQARKRLVNAINSSKSSIIKTNFINMLAKFTTLEEAENGLLKDYNNFKPIERFLGK